MKTETTILLALMLLLSLPSCVTRDEPTTCHRITVGIGMCVMWMHGPEWWVKRDDGWTKPAMEEKQ